MFAYIDPGTGSMLITLCIGIATAFVFTLRLLIIKLKFIVSAGTKKKTVMPDLPFVIFSDNKRYRNVFKPVCDEFEKRQISLVYYTLSPDDPVLCEKYKYIKAEYIGTGNKAFFRLNTLCADIVISTTPNLDVYQWKRSKNVKFYVHIPHTVNELADYKMFGLDFYDAVLTTGDNQMKFIRKMESLRPAAREKELITVGSPVLDTLQQRYVSNKKDNSEIVVLLAPSWGPKGMLSKYGEKLLSALQQTDFKIIVRPHPQSVISEENIINPLKDRFCDFEWNYDIDNFDVLNKADILISDFSGIFFEFACVFNKPVIYTDSFNTSSYDADWLDEPCWSLRVLPEIGTALTEDNLASIKDVIIRSISDNSLKNGREKIKNECWQNIGNSAGLIADYLINKQSALSP